MKVEGAVKWPIRLPRSDVHVIDRLTIIGRRGGHADEFILLFLA